MVEQLKSHHLGTGGDIASIAPLTVVKSIGGYPHTIEHVETRWGRAHRKTRPTHIDDLMRAAQSLDWVSLCARKAWSPDAINRMAGDMMVWRHAGELTERGKRYVYCVSWRDPEDGRARCESCPLDELPGEWLAEMKKRLLEEWAAINMPY